MLLRGTMFTNSVYKFFCLQICCCLQLLLFQDVAVVGIEDLTWGQKVAAAVVLTSSEQLTLQQLK